MTNSDHARMVEALQRLVPAAQTGDPSALEQVLRLVHPFVLRGCRARLGRAHHTIDPEETAQDVLLAITTSIARYDSGNRPFLAWVAAITGHKATDAFRRYCRDPTTPSAQLPQHADPSDTPEAALLRAERADQLRALLAHLPPLHQTILVLRLIEQLSATDTANLVGMTPGSVRVAQHRALNRLRRLAGEAGAGAEGPRPRPSSRPDPSTSDANFDTSCPDVADAPVIAPFQTGLEAPDGLANPPTGRLRETELPGPNSEKEGTPLRMTETQNRTGRVLRVADMNMIIDERDIDAGRVGSLTVAAAPPKRSQRLLSRVRGGICTVLLHARQARRMADMMTRATGIPKLGAYD